MADPNLFALEPLIINHIKAIVPGLETVDSVSIIAGVEDITPFLPAAFVQPMGSEVKDTARRGKDIVDGQGWIVNVCVANYRDASGVTPAQRAGVFAGPIVKALSGWCPEGKKPMLFTGRPDPYYDVGHAEFPLSFSYDFLL